MYATIEYQHTHAYKYANTYNEAYVVIESNDQGAVVCNGLYYDLEYENMFVESTVKANALGATMTRRVKRVGCSSIKDLIEQKKLTIYDAQTIIEMSTFVSKGNSYQAAWRMARKRSKRGEILKRKRGSVSSR